MNTPPITQKIIFNSQFTSFSLYNSKSCKKDVAINIKNCNEPVHISFNMSDKSIIRRKGEDIDILFPKSTYTYGSIKEEISIIYPEIQKINFIDIQFSPQFLIENETGRYKKIYLLLNKIENCIFSEKISLTSAFMQSIIYEIIEFHTQYHCDTFQSKNLFYTGKILAILECVAERITDEMSSSAKFAHNIGQAKEILESDLINPPSLEILANRVGMSLPHFKRIFKQLTGITAYGFLKQKRMQVALTLLLNDSQTISQIADQVGYNSKSHFTKAFVEHFGVRPSSFRRATCSELPELKNPDSSLQSGRTETKKSSQ